jgi:alpha-tubulin suppressor-like RCC1 family protein
MKQRSCGIVGSFKKAVSIIGIATSLAVSIAGADISINDRTTGNNQNQFEYSSGWSAVTGSSGNYYQDYTQSSTLNSFFYVRFYGTQIAFYGRKGTDGGKAAFSIDGGAESTQDFYASSTKPMQLVFTSAKLTSGLHVLKCRVLGTRSAGSGYAVRPDYATITSDFPNPSRWYELASKSSASLCVNVSATPGDNVNVDLQKYSGSDRQQFRFIATGGGHYKILVRNDRGYGLTVYNTLIQNNSNVSVNLADKAHDNTENDSKQWKLVADGGGYYYLACKLNNGFCLSSGGTAGSNVNIYQFVKSANSELWQFQEVPESATWYRLSFLHSGKILDPTMARYQAVQWSNTNSVNQYIRFTPAPTTGYYYLYSQYNAVLGSTANSTLVQAMGFLGDGYQQYRIQASPASGYSYLINMQTKNAMMVDGGSGNQYLYSDGASIIETPVRALSGYENQVVQISPAGFRKVAAAPGNQAASYFLTNDNTLWACGDNEFGQLGDGTTTNRSTPVKVMSDVEDVAAGNWFALILKVDGTLWACGTNVWGQFGNGTTQNSNIWPVYIRNGVKSIAVGNNHSLFLTTGGELWGSGLNDYYQLGLNFTNMVIYANLVVSGVKCMAGGSGHTLIVKTDGTLWACGKGQSGQLGLGNTNNYYDLQKTSMTNVKKVAAGYDHSVIMLNDGSVYACGSNFSGQVGNNSSVNALIPVKISTGIGAGVKDIAAGGNQTFILANDQTLYSCGRNNYGMLCNSDNISLTYLTQATYNVASVASAQWHSILIQSDGTVRTFGANYYGELGDGTTTASIYPLWPQLQY